MDILPTTNATIRETYSRYDVKQTMQKESETASGGNSDSVFLSQFLSYEQYTYSADITANGSNALPSTDANSVGQSDGTTASDGASPQQYSNKFLEIIQNRVKFLLEALAGKTTDSSGSGSSAASSDTTVSPSDGTANTSDPSYYSAEQTAARIVGFALAFFDGGDRAAFASKIGDAVMKGYNQALDAMGGSLPSIANDTISQVMDQLQQFASGTDVNTVA